MIPDLGFVVAAFAEAIEVTIEHQGATTYPLGVAVTAAPVSEVVEAVVLPAGGRALERLTDGDQTRELIELYFTNAVSISGSRPSGAGSPRPPDVVIWGGVRYVVQTAEPWGPAGYQRVIAAREGA